MGDFDGCINEFETEENSTQIRCLPPFPPCALRKDTTRIKFMALVVVSKSSTTIGPRMATSEPIKVTKLDNEVSRKIKGGTMSPSLRRRKREDVTIQDESSTNLENDDPEPEPTTWDGEIPKNTHDDNNGDTDDGRETTWDGEIPKNTHEDNNGDTDDGRKTTWDGEIPKNTKITEPAMQIDLVAYLEWPDNNFSRFWRKIIAITYMKIIYCNLLKHISKNYSILSK